MKSYENALNIRMTTDIGFQSKIRVSSVAEIGFRWLARDDQPSALFNRGISSLANNSRLWIQLRLSSQS